MTTNIREVARRAGVSVATVSRVTSGNAPVNQDTKARVQKALDELNYVPSRLGRALSSKKHDACGIVFPALGGPMFAGILRGFSDTLQAHQVNYHILVPVHPDEAEQQVMDLATRIDGLCVFGDVVSNTHLQHLSERLPIVRIAGDENPSIMAVDIDNATASRELTEHLIDHGYRRIEFFGESSHSPDVAARFEGYRAAVQNADCMALQHDVPLTQIDALVAAERLIAKKQLPEALVCASDEMAVGVYLACHNAGISIGKGLAIVGFDDIPIAQHITPPLTTATQPFEAMGERAATLLLNRATLSNTAPFAAGVTLRSSCGCPTN